MQLKIHFHCQPVLFWAVFYSKTFAVARLTYKKTSDIKKHHHHHHHILSFRWMFLHFVPSIVLCFLLVFQVFYLYFISEMCICASSIWYSQRMLFFLFLWLVLKLTHLHLNILALVYVLLHSLVTTTGWERREIWPQVTFM